MSKKRWLDKQNVIYSYNGLLFSHKKGGSTDTHYNMDVEIMVRRSQTQKALHCVIHIYELSRIGKFTQIESRLVAAQGKQKGWEIQVSFWGDVNALKLYTGNGCKHCEYNKNKCIVHFKMIKMVTLMCIISQKKKKLNKYTKS